MHFFSGTIDLPSAQDDTCVSVVWFLKNDDRKITSHRPQTFPDVSPSVRIIKILKILGCDKTSTFPDSTLLVRILNAEVLQNNKGKGKGKG